MTDRINRRINQMVEDIIRNGHRMTDAQVAEGLELIGRAVRRAPKPKKPETALNRSARKRLEQLAKKP